MYLKHEGQEYEIPAIGTIKLYPVSKLLEALTCAGYPKTAQTVRKWGARKVVPPSIFKRGRDRLYSQEQIDCIVKCVVSCNLRSFIPITPFHEMIWKELLEVDKKLKERGNVYGKIDEEKPCKTAS